MKRNGHEKPASVSRKQRLNQMAGTKRPRVNGQMNATKWLKYKPIVDSLFTGKNAKGIAGATGWSSTTIRLIAESTDFDNYVHLQKIRNGLINEQKPIDDIPAPQTEFVVNVSLTDAVIANTKALNNLTEILSKAKKVRF